MAGTPQFTRSRLAMLPSAETNWISMNIGSPAGIIRVSSCSTRFESVLLPILSVPLLRRLRLGIGAAPGTRTS
jgi:hypothetical protein